MKVAWFRACDDTAALIAELQRTRRIDVFTAANVNDFASRHAADPYSMCVYELDHAAEHAFAWPYVLQHSGVILLRSLMPPHLDTAIRASQATAVPHSAVVAVLQEAYPNARVRYAPIPAANVPQVQGVPSIDDVVVSLRWPHAGEPQTAALSAMAAGKPVILFETDATADWPMLDPQTWQSRGPAGTPPIAISIDPRDEEHSLALAMRRLSADPDLRAALGKAGYEWWRDHASPAVAARIWMSLLEELTPPTDIRARS